MTSWHTGLTIKSLKFPDALRKAEGWIGLLPLAEFLAEAFRPQQMLEIGPSGSNFCESVKQSLNAQQISYNIKWLNPADPDAAIQIHDLSKENHKQFDVIHFAEQAACALIVDAGERGVKDLLELLRPGGIVLVDGPEEGSRAKDIVEKLAAMGPVWNFIMDEGLTLAAPKGTNDESPLRQLDQIHEELNAKGWQLLDELRLHVLTGQLVTARLKTRDVDVDFYQSCVFAPIDSREISFNLEGTDADELIFVPGESPLRLKFRQAKAEDAAGESGRIVLAAHNADNERNGILSFATKQPEIRLRVNGLGKLVKVTVQLEYLAAGADASEAMLKELYEEIGAAHRLIDAKEQDIANTRVQLLAIQGSLTWRLARLALRPVDVLFGKERMARVSGKLRGSKHADIAIEFDRDYRRWVKQCDTLTEAERRKIRNDIALITKPLLISVIVPTYNTEQKWLVKCIESVRNQLYPHWELCLVDDASTKPHVRRVLEGYSRKDTRIKVLFREKNGHICAASNSALKLATGEFVALLDHDDELTEHALYWIARAAADNEALDLIYTDEDKIDARGRRFAPHFKPDWNPDMLLSQNYICHLTAIRRSLIGEIGGFREGYEGSQDYDLVLRASRHISPERIRHIPRICYHWRAVEGSTALSLEFKDYCTSASRQAVTDHLQARGMAARAVAGSPSCIHRVAFFRAKDPLVSIIIPTKNRCDLLERLIADVLGKTEYRNLELVIIDHESDEKESLVFLQDIGREPRVRVFRFEGPFNYSAINNYASRQARGEVLAFLNNDLRVITRDWLNEMAGHALRPEIGAVGAKLFYPDDTIQHAGLILGIKDGVAESQFLGLSRNVIGFAGRTHILQNISAVTAACMVLRRELFEKAGGFDEVNLPVAFNDVDLCLTLIKMGYKNVFTPFAQFYHFESTSRGSDMEGEAHERFARELGYMKTRWAGVLESDPNYNPNLSLERTDFSLAWPSEKV